MDSLPRGRSVLLWERGMIPFPPPPSLAFHSTGLLWVVSSCWFPCFTKAGVLHPLNSNRGSRSRCFCSGGVSVLRLVPSAVPHRHLAASSRYRARRVRAATRPAAHSPQEQGAPLDHSAPGSAWDFGSASRKGFLVVHTNFSLEFHPEKVNFRTSNRSSTDRS